MNEIQELKIQYETATNGLALIRREISTLEPLVKSGLAPETRLIALQRGKRKQVLVRQIRRRVRKKRLVSGLDEIDEQLKAEKQFYKTSALTDLSSIEGEMNGTEHAYLRWKADWANFRSFTSRWSY